MSDVPIYLNEKIEIEQRVSDLLNRLTLKEKFRLLTSHGRLRIYTTPPITRLGIPSFKTSDGPLGVAMHSSGFKKNTRFPATISLAATWNRTLAQEVGAAMGEEMRAVGRHVLLAPGMNIARTPLNGRTFEYFSEDPYLTREMAIPVVKGIQSMRVAGCLKHYAANNQETDRRSSSSEIDERTLHEIYLRAFRGTVRDAQPWSVMTAYNMVNGTFACENKYLIKEILMDTWGFDGIVMTDWFASRGDNKTTEDCINAGLSLEMPWPSKYKTKSLEIAHKEGQFSDKMVDDLVRRNLRVMLRTGLFDPPELLPQGARNTMKHQELARQAAEEGIVLLKNTENLLPLDIDGIKQIAIYGKHMKKKFGRLLSGGSSAVSPPHEVTPIEGLSKKTRGKIQWVDYGKLTQIMTNTAIVFVGLDHNRGGDSESSDRESLHLEENQVNLVKQVAREFEKTIVCIIAGSPIAMDDWIDDVEAVLMCWYGGMEAGHAIANVLFGDVNPSGRLPLTFPRRLEDSPAHSTGNARNYPGDEEKKVYYDEGIFVGYRWFDKKRIEPLFPFGFGLSFTEFEYGPIRVERDTLHSPEDILKVEIGVTNIGNRAGSEVIQLYVQDLESSVDRPPKELVGFEKMWLEPKQKKAVSIIVKAEDLSFYDPKTHEWIIEQGDFRLMVGKSSRNIEREEQFSFN
jgi:beta-glucosidase